MTNVATLPIEADRYGACVREIHVVGLDLTGVPMRAQVRLGGDVPGAPLVDLLTVANGNAEGLRLVGVEWTDGLPTSHVQLVINESSMESLPFAGELGDATRLRWDWQLTIAGRKQRIARGDFVITGDGVTGADAAPVGRTAGGVGAWSMAGGMRTGATLTFGDEVIAVSVDGAALIAPQLARATRAADDAEDSREAARLASATAEATVGPTYASVAAGLAATAANGSFGVATGGGLVAIYRKVNGAAVLQRRLATSDALASSLPGAGRDLIGRPTVAALLASTAPARGAGSLWYADDFTYVEAAANAVDHAVQTAGGVKLYVQPGPRGYDARAFGAGIDGADDGSAIRGAIYAGRAVAVPAGTYQANGVGVTTGRSVQADAAMIETVSDASTIFLVDGARDWKVGGFGLVGTRTASVDPATQNEVGLSVRDATRGVVANMTFRDFKKVGLWRNASSITLEGGTGRGARVLGYGLGFYNCTIGLKTEPHGGNEYDVYGVLHAGGCDVGVDLNAGNTILCGFQLVDNLLNLRMRGGANNHAHGILCAGAINHLKNGGTYLAHFSDIYNGQTLSAVHAYANGVEGNGPLFIERSGGINWTTGILDAWTYVKQNGFDGAAHFPYNRQEGLYLPGDYGPAQIFGRKADDSGWDDYSPYLIRRGCFGPGLLDQSGVTTNDPADLYVLAEQNGVTVPFAQGAFLRFPSVTRIGDRRKCYDPATGLVTIPKWMDGLYEYSATFVIAGQLADVAGSYLELIVDYAAANAPTRAIAPPILPQPFGNGQSLWIVSTGVIAVHLAAGDTIGLRATAIGGANPGLGQAAYGSQFTLKKIA